MQIVANIHHGKCIESFGLPAHGIPAYYLQTFGHITLLPKVVLKSHKSELTFKEKIWIFLRSSNLQAVLFVYKCINLRFFLNNTNEFEAKENFRKGPSHSWKTQ